MFQMGELSLLSGLLQELILRSHGTVPPIASLTIPIERHRTMRLRVQERLRRFRSICPRITLDTGSMWQYQPLVCVSLHMSDRNQKTIHVKKKGAGRQSVDSWLWKSMDTSDIAWTATIGKWRNSTKITRYLQKASKRAQPRAPSRH